MSLYLKDEPKLWYMGYAIYQYEGIGGTYWIGYTDDGIRSYSVIEERAETLGKLKSRIKQARRGQ